MLLFLYFIYLLNIYNIISKVKPYKEHTENTNKYPCWGRSATFTCLDFKHGYTDWQNPKKQNCTYLINHMIIFNYLDCLQYYHFPNSVSAVPVLD